MDCKTFSVAPRATMPKSVAGQVFLLVRTTPRGVTVDELCLRLPHASPSTVSSAIESLTKRELVVWSGEHRDTRYGRPAKVYVRRKAKK